MRRPVLAAALVALVAGCSGKPETPPRAQEAPKDKTSELKAPGIPGLGGSKPPTK
jgi:uncharacterized lipoprotein